MSTIETLVHAAFRWWVVGSIAFAALLGTLMQSLIVPLVPSSRPS